MINIVLTKHIARSDNYKNLKKMYFSKSTIILTLIAACCVMAQLDKYDKLSVNDFKEMCKKNGIDENKIGNVSELVGKFFFENYKEMSSDEALKTDSDCLGPNLQILLQEEMKIAQSCLNNEIILKDNDIETLIKRSVKRLCALYRLASFEKSLSDCLDTVQQDECETEVLDSFNSSLADLMKDSKYVNFGLTYSPEKRQIWDNMFDCSSNSTEMCDAEQQKMHLLLTERMKETMIVRN